jgi:hypothetical protein
VDFKEGTIEIRQSLKRQPDSSLVVGPPKVDSYRNLRLPTEVIDALRAHKVSQKKKELAAHVWDNRDGLVFTTARGTPIPRICVGPFQIGPRLPTWVIWRPTNCATRLPPCWLKPGSPSSRLPTCSVTRTSACWRRSTGTRSRGSSTSPGAKPGCCSDRSSARFGWPQGTGNPDLEHIFAKRRQSIDTHPY